jgi:hypothetical protein
MDRNDLGRMQLSVFQCRLSVRRHTELIALLDGIKHHNHDHVILMDAGLADQIAPRIVSLGKLYLPVEPARFASGRMVVRPPGSARAWKLFKNQAVNLVDPEKGLSR